VIKFKFIGAKVINNRINRTIKELEDNFLDMVLQETDNIKNIAKSNVPVAKVNGGTLRNSFYALPPEIFRGKLRVEIGFNAHYAAYQDMGTGTGGKGSNGKKFDSQKLKGYEEYTERFIGEKHPKRPTPPVAPRRFLLYPFILATRKIDRKTKTIVKNLMK
jgi:hypothetical protein